MGLADEIPGPGSPAVTPNSPLRWARRTRRARGSAEFQSDRVVVPSTASSGRWLGGYRGPSDKQALLHASGRVAGRSCAGIHVLRAGSSAAAIAKLAHPFYPSSGACRRPRRCLASSRHHAGAVPQRMANEFFPHDHHQASTWPSHCPCRGLPDWGSTYSHPLRLEGASAAADGRRRSCWRVHLVPGCAIAAIAQTAGMEERPDGLLMMAGQRMAACANWCPRPGSGAIASSRYGWACSRWPRKRQAGGKGLIASFRRVLWLNAASPCRPVRQGWCVAVRSGSWPSVRSGARRDLPPLMSAGGSDHRRADDARRRRHQRRKLSELPTLKGTLALGYLVTFGRFIGFTAYVLLRTLAPTWQSATLHQSGDAVMLVAWLSAEPLPPRPRRDGGDPARRGRDHPGSAARRPWRRHSM